MRKYDVIIVGAGPAGIFAALELAGRARVLLIDRGRDIAERERKDLFSGFGGAGAFSDGKLNLTGEVGGYLNQYVGGGALASLIDRVDSVFLSAGAPEGLKGTDNNKINEVRDLASKSGLRLINFPIRHLGTDRCVEVLKNLRAVLEAKVDLAFSTDVVSVMKSDGRVSGVVTEKGEAISADYVILAPGRVGAGWLHGLSRDMGLKTASNQVDIGVRVEVPAAVLADVTDVLHEAKFVYDSKRFDDRVRTFCMNPYGVVVEERHADFSTVNGHSYSTRKSENTNFAVLVSTSFTEPFDEPIKYGEYIARLANLLGEGIIVQRLGDLEAGRRSTRERLAKCPVRATLAAATPGDLSFAVPYRYITDVLEMLHALDAVAPGVASPSTLLYGVEVKFYSMRLKLTAGLETDVRNLFAVGDGAGVTRGIVQAAASGLIASKEILKRAGAR